LVDRKRIKIRTRLDSPNGNHLNILAGAFICSSCITARQSEQRAIENGAAAHRSIGSASLAIMQVIAGFRILIFSLRFRTKTISNWKTKMLAGFF